MKYWFLFKETGDMICGFSQRAKNDNVNDTIGADAKFNIKLNSLICVGVPKKCFDRFKIDKIKAHEVNQYLMNHGYAPY